jgi:hypothetical protein
MRRMQRFWIAAGLGLVLLAPFGSSRPDGLVGLLGRFGFAGDGGAPSIGETVLRGVIGLAVVIALPRILRRPSRSGPRG